VVPKQVTAILSPSAWFFRSRKVFTSLALGQNSRGDPRGHPLRSQPVGRSSQATPPSCPAV